MKKGTSPARAELREGPGRGTTSPGEALRPGKRAPAGGLDAFDERVQTDLAGYPAVVNIWASLVRTLPGRVSHFQQVSARMGKKLAFLGVNSDDNSDAAKTFSRPIRFPFYPSYEDPDRTSRSPSGPPLGLPGTAFFNTQTGN